MDVDFIVNVNRIVRRNCREINQRKRVNKSEISKPEYTINLSIMKPMTPQVKLENLSTYDQIKLEGKIKGKLEGKLEGKIKGKLEVAVNLFYAGMDIDFIVKVTELSRELIEKTIKENE